MTSGILHPVLWLLFASASAANPAAPLDPAALVASLARPPPAQAAYTEVRFAAMFAHPVITRGELEYLGPGHFVKTTTEPFHERAEIANGAVTTTRGNGTAKHFPLDRIPALRPFLDGFGALLGGDAAALARDFELELRGDEQRWQLQLHPRDDDLGRRITSITVDGRNREPVCFTTREADGDESVLLTGPLAGQALPPRPSPGALAMRCAGGDAPR